MLWNPVTCFGFDTSGRWWRWRAVDPPPDDPSEWTRTGDGHWYLPMVRPSTADRFRLTVPAAIAIATHAHWGQLDRGGEPYINHPLAVMAMVEGDDAKIVAVLHDVPEDTPITVDDLRAAGVTDDQAAALRALTRGPGVPYVDYVRHALRHPLARVVKVADYDHNTDPARLALLLPQVAARLRRKYASVASLIEAARHG